MPASEFSDVFISYRRKDVEFTKTLVKALQDEGKECWVDWEDIPPGSEGFTDDIKRGLEGADAFLAILSPDYLDSTYCVDMELGTAIALKKKLIPIVLKKFDDKPIPAGIGHINWIYFTPHAGHENTFEESFPKVMAALNADLAHARAHARYQIRAIEWDNNKREDSFLLDGVEITEAEQWISSSAGKIPEPTPLHGEYIIASRTFETQKQRRLVSRMAALVVVAVIFGVISLFMFSEARRQEQVAQEALNVAQVRGTEIAQEKQISETNLLQAWSIQSRFLIDVARQQLNSGMPQTALLTSLQSMANYPAVFNPDSYSVAYAALASSVQEMVFMPHHSETTQVFGAVWNTDETQLLTWADDHLVRVWDITQKPPTTVIELPHDDQINGARWTHDMQHILSWSNDDTAQIRAISGGAEAKIFHHESSVLGATLTQDETRLLTWTLNGTVTVWDVATQTSLLTYQHQGQVRGGAWFKDEARIVSWAEDGIARIVPIETPDAPIIMEHSATVEGAVLTQDEQRLLSWTLDGNVLIWDVTTGEQLKQFVHNARVLGARWNADETQVASWSEDRSVRIHDVATNQDSRIFEQNSWISGALWNKDETLLLTWNWDGEVILWDLVRDRDPVIMQAERAQPISLEWSEDETKILVGSFASAAYLWDISQHPPRLTVLRHNTRQILRGAHWNSDESQIVTISNDGSARIWDLNYNLREHRLRHDGFVQGAAWNADNTQILTWSNDRTARIWGVDTEEEIVLQHMATVAGARWNNAETHVLSWTWGGTVHLWDVATQETRSIQLDSTVRGALFNAAESQVLAWSQAGAVVLWNLETNATIPMSHTRPVQGAVFNQDNSLVMSWSEDGTVQVWDVTNGENRLTLTHDSSVGGAAWNADESAITAWTIPGGIYQWDAATGAEKFTARHDGSIKGALLNAARDRLLSWSNDGTLRLWDNQTGAELQRLTYHLPIAGAIFNQTETQVMAWREGAVIGDGEAFIWDLATNTLVAAFRHPGRPVHGAAWSPDETAVLTRSWDNTVRVWRLTGEQTEPLILGHLERSAGFEEGIWSAAWSLDGKRILTVPSDGTARIWIVDIPQFIEFAQSRQHREFFAVEKETAFLASSAINELVAADNITIPEPLATNIPVLLAGTVVPTAQPNSTPIPPTVSQTATTQQEVALRAGRDAIAPIVTMIPADAAVDVITFRGNHLYVGFAEVFGWVPVNAVKLETSLSAIPVRTGGTITDCPLNKSLFAETWAQKHWLLGCPATEVRAVLSTAQPYVNGIMTWRSDTRNIFVMLYDGRWSVYEDTYNPGDELTCSSPFTALGFGKVYCSNPEVQAMLGEPLGPERTATLVVQVYENGSILETINTGRLVLVGQTELVYK